MTPIEAYIREAAQKRGIDPNVAVRVAQSEGGLEDPNRQSNFARGGRREPSFGPFQLLIGGGGTGFSEGVGNRALAAGIDPRDPANVYKGIDFALDVAAKEGWGQWYGAAKSGIGNRAGLDGARTAGITPDLSPAALDFVKNNPQPGGFGAGVPDPNSSPSVFGSMSPGGGGGGQMVDNSTPMVVANHVSSLGDGSQKKNPLGEAGAAFDQAAKEYPAPRIDGAFGGDARQMGEVLMKAMQNPQALAQLLMKQRLG